MEKFDLFKDLAERTGGDVYIGVVGPVRTGKSTFIKRFMERMILPAIEDLNDRERAQDSLPQSGTGKTIMTTEPKFIPDEAVEIQLTDAIAFRARLVDCVGYAVPGALGYLEEDGARMVMTPWADEAMPFEEAAEIGTRKVIQDHSTIGLVVTTDGSFGDLPREAYLDAEERVISELKELGKPFVVLLNSSQPASEEAMALALELQEKYDVPVIPVNCQELQQEDIVHILEQVLYEFPVTDISFQLTDWVEALMTSHWLRKQIDTALDEAKAAITRLRDVDPAVNNLRSYDYLDDVRLVHMDLGTGIAEIFVGVQGDLFFRVLGELADRHVATYGDIMKLWREYVVAKAEWDKVEEAVHEVRATGYGMVAPSLTELNLAEPEPIRRGAQFGVKLKATAPSIHMIRADIETEITPIIGTERQADELVQYLMEQFEDDPVKLWETNLFGKSLHDLVRESIQSKLFKMPENAQEKLQETLQRIINEGSGGLICIII
ncbi:stage IV sporulation protein A [Sulfobacillus thermosulfidooxidans]|uniref:stage IV sporulation protein A n=1 Tax=Sulfobacillus thermosulfidooxidans TaxID=28034 RepID=UPI0006B64912|nr:stage IV sporulation protein A [Sulfobacillus thermosulfidooxidans]